MRYIFRRFSCQFRRWLVWLWHLEGTPGQRARGLAAGVFSGCFPFFGLQSFLGLVVASLIRGNHLLAVIGTWISNPVTYVPLYWFNFKVGSLLLREERGVHAFSKLTWLKIWSEGPYFMVRLIIGSSFIGAISAIIVGISSYLLMIRWSNRNHF